MAKFEEVADELSRRVRDGIYTTSQRLPSEYDLAKEFGVSRLTVRKAIELLIRKRLLVKSPGKGTYVMSYSDKVESGRMGLQGFTEAAKAYGKKSRTEVLSFGPLAPIPEEIGRVLGCDQHIHKTVDLLVRRRFWDEEPMTVEHVAICHEYIDGLQPHDFEGSLFALLEKRVAIAYSHQEVEAVLMDPDLAALLNGRKGDPLLLVHSVTYTADAKPILYDISYYRADKYSFKSTLTRDHV
ncbi:GntR family transcriptional regulator, LSA1692 subfamily [Lacticaseibacillus chiayiensis]|uniref:GntR family transcriptional regulator, LSA1692 subfamily n=1 Tax=Lacticaseibacillus chiayiensis TaxID=2100821 RepID=UPI001010A6D5|nr:GntR family transcriptional regulator, LSA1692 subfamily [Lacticaseibacillus chiayiensis]QVI34619.1 GntR family transcriptional regulator [Lacticaseibacillus chiayiensis]RXT58999.1 GntR family transcriptional regulator [Lacticaseibacillus chiayiensis]